MVKEIPLTRNKVAIVDESDFEWLAQYNWQAYDRGNTWYAKARLPSPARAPLYAIMHRMIVGCPIGLEVDHINGDGLDNRRCNLRIVTHAQNMANMRRKSGTKGVCRFRDKFRAYIVKDGRQRHLGVFADMASAAKAYDRAALELFGQHAAINANGGAVRW